MHESKSLTSNTLEAIAHYIQSKPCKRIIVMTGAGISTSAGTKKWDALTLGIPDFRSPGTGLYDNLQKYDLPFPEAIFHIHYFRRKPEPFYTLAKELFPGLYTPTLCHYFIKLLADKSLLLRNYTQNIDTLERLAGIEGDVLVEAHGSFSTAHCVGYSRLPPLESPSLASSEQQSTSDEKKEIEKESDNASKSSPVTQENPDHPPDTTDHHCDTTDSSSDKPTHNPPETTENTHSDSPHPVDSDHEEYPFSDQESDSDSSVWSPNEETVVAGCGQEYSMEWIKKKIFDSDTIHIPRCEHCPGLVKPDIVFFGESLPTRFYELMHQDFAKADLLIVMGTSLKVHPFAALVDAVGPNVPRLLINREVCGDYGLAHRGFDFQGRCQPVKRDAYFLGSCDEGCLALAELLGWKQELMSMASLSNEDALSKLVDDLSLE